MQSDDWWSPLGGANGCRRFRATGYTAWLLLLVACTGDPSGTLEGPSASDTGEFFFTESFEDGDAASRGWFANTEFTLSTSESHSGSASLELHFAAGAVTPEFGNAARILFPPTETVYLRYWVKYSNNWVGSGQAAHPHEFTLITNEDDRWVGPAFTHLTVYVEHNYQGGLIPRLLMQDAANIDQSRVGQDLTAVTERRAAGGCNGNLDGYPTACYDAGGVHRNTKRWDADGPVLFAQPGPTDQNAWHLVEAYFELNTIRNGIGQADGIAQYWLDGALIIDVQDALLRTGIHPEMAFTELLIAPYMGNGSPVAQTMWVDDLRVGDGR